MRFSGRITRTRLRPVTATGFVLASAAIAACGETPTTPVLSDGHQAQASSASATNSAAPFQTWHQGFNSGTTGWYGGATPGSLGWCGTVEQVDGRAGPVAPSAGRGYALVGQGACNDFWDQIFSSPGAQIVNAPWAPGPEFALLSDEWPASGFVLELDIYLDPAWKTSPLDPGTVNFFAPPGTVFTYAASLRELASPADAFGTFHYWAVPVFSDNGALSVLGHGVTEAGWYTFRHVFRDDGGSLAVDFELADRTGGTLFTESLDTEFFTGTPTSSFDPHALGSGYSWFPAITTGLELPIDEHRLRRGR